MNQEPNVRLHVIRTDVLLHRLGGFSEAGWHYRIGRASLTADQIRGIMRAAASARFAWGDAARLAQILGLRTSSFRVMVCRARRGRTPRYWQDIA